MKINGYVFPVALALAVLAGAYGYGQQSERVDDNNRRIEALEKTPLKVQEIDKSQAVMGAEIKAMRQEQQVFQAHAQRQLDRILRKLDE